MPATEVDAELLRCPVCQQRLTEPKVLPCGHTACDACLDSLVTVECEQRTVKCPECSVDSKVPENGFPRNFKLIGACSSNNIQGRTPFFCTTGHRYRCAEQDLRRGAPEEV